MRLRTIYTIKISKSVLKLLKHIVCFIFNLKKLMFIYRNFGDNIVHSIKKYDYSSLGITFVQQTAILLKRIIYKLIIKTFSKKSNE